MSNNNDKKNRVTKEIALAITPLVAAYLFVAFYEAGFCEFFGIPLDLISINLIDVFLTNRLTLMVAVLAFLWIGLYYNVLPSVSSPLFKGMITAILILSLSLGFTFGKSDAENRVDYLVMKSQPEMVVLKIFGDTIVSTSIERNTKRFKKEFMLRKVAPQDNTIYQLQAIGPLAPATP